MAVEDKEILDDINNEIIWALSGKTVPFWRNLMRKTTFDWHCIIRRRFSREVPWWTGHDYTWFEEEVGFNPWEEHIDWLNNNNM